jgi:hypothetical protein
MEKRYLLVDHQFLATPTLDAFYVIALGAAGQLPQIVDKINLDGPLRNGASFQLEFDEVGQEFLHAEEGDIFSGNMQLEMLFAGRVLVETADYVRDHTMVRLSSYFNGGMIDTTNRSITVAGIGITDILATDPLNVGLVEAPLTTIPYFAGPGADPVERRVVGIFLDYQPLPFNSLTGAVAASTVDVKIAVERFGGPVR